MPNLSEILRHQVAAALGRAPDAASLLNPMERTRTGRWISTRGVSALLAPFGCVFLLGAAAQPPNANFSDFRYEGTQPSYRDLKPKADEFLKRGAEPMRITVRSCSEAIRCAILPPGQPVPLVVKRTNLPDAPVADWPIAGDYAVTDRFQGSELSPRWSLWRRSSDPDASLCEARDGACVSIYSRIFVTLPSRTVYRRPNFP